MNLQHRKELGDFLRQERERKGRTPEDIAESLKITSTNILRIEKGDVESIGLGDIFIKSYIKAYISELGYSPDEILAKYNIFDEGELNKIKKENSKASIFYNPYIQILAIILFSASLYLFVGYFEKTAPQTELKYIPSGNINSNYKEDVAIKKQFSNDYNKIYTNYSEIEN